MASNRMTGLCLRSALVRPIALLVLLLVACDSPSPDPGVSPIISPIPGPGVATAALEYPPPQPGLGAVVGRLVAGSETGLGYVGGDLYLGSLIPGSDPNAQPVVAFSEGVDPKAVVYNQDGTFAFTNIVPGTYALAVWTPANSFVIEAPGGALIEVVVRADQTTDLGTIVVP